MNYLKLAASAAIFLAGCTVTSWYYGKQIATMQKEAAEATTKAVKAAMDKTQADQKRKDEAINEANKRAEKNAALARALDGDIDRMREQLAASDSGLSKANAEAARKYASAAKELFGSCAKEYLDMARSAQGHAEDARLVRESWPLH